MARLYREGPHTFPALAAHLAASRDTLTETLAKLEATGVLLREEGSGKRPRYALTPVGMAVGAHCVRLVEMVSANPDVLPVALKKWPMLVVVALGRGAARYNAVKAALPGITPRSLALALKDLLKVAMIDRTVENGYPPAPNYVLAQRGEAFFVPLEALCEAAAAAVLDS